MILEEANLSQNSRYDLIFMNYNMPILDGCEATALIRDFLYKKGQI